MKILRLRNTLVIGSASVVFAIGAPAWAQSETPDFSGTWRMVNLEIGDERRSQAGDRQIEVVQSQSQISIANSLWWPGATLTFNLDGSESRNETLTAAGDTWERVTVARWVGSAIVFDTTINTPGESFQQVETLYRGSDGVLKFALLDSDTVMPQTMVMVTASYRRE